MYIYELGSFWYARYDAARWAVDYLFCFSLDYYSNITARVWHAFDDTLFRHFTRHSYFSYASMIRLPRAGHGEWFTALLQSIRCLCFDVAQLDYLRRRHHHHGLGMCIKPPRLAPRTTGAKASTHLFTTPAGLARVYIYFADCEDISFKFTMPLSSFCTSKFLNTVC